MKRTALAAIVLAALPLASQAAEDSATNPHWNACLIARQVAANGAALAINRVCAAPNVEFSIFEGYQMGERPALQGSLGPTSLDSATMVFNGMRSRYSDNDSRHATLWIKESGPAGTGRAASHDLKLTVDQEAVIATASGSVIYLRLDMAHQPTTFDQSLKMPTWNR